MSDRVRGRRVVLWRHGRTEWNVEHRVQGHTDIALDPVGRQEARDSSARLATLAPYRIVSSDLSRAADTARALADRTGLEVTLDPRLRELAFGVVEGLTWPEAWQRYPDEMRSWSGGDQSRIDGAETHRDGGARFAQAVREYLHDLPLGETLVVVAHGGIVRTGTLSFLGVPYEAWSHFGGLANCHWSVLLEERYEQWSHWRLTEWNSGTLPEPILSDEEA